MMRPIRKFFIAVVGMILPKMAAAETVPVIQNVNAYESMSLNGQWNYIVDVQEEGYYDYRMNPTRSGFFVNAKPQKPEDLIETRDKQILLNEQPIFLKGISIHNEKPNGGGRANSVEDARTLDDTRLISMAMEVTGASRTTITGRASSATRGRKRRLSSY